MNFRSRPTMFGATAVRRKREKERRERAARNSANTIYPYIKPFGNFCSMIFNQFCTSGPRFDKYELPYYKHRRHLQNDVRDLKVGLNQFIFIKIIFDSQK